MIAALGHFISWGLRTHVHLCADDQWRDHRTRQHHPPVQTLDVVGVDIHKRHIDDIPEHNPERSPHLPHHHQRAADCRRAAFRGVYRDGGGFRADSEAEEEACNEEMLPGVGEGLPKTGGKGDETGDEDGVAAAEVFVEGMCNPAADGEAAEVRGGVDEAFEPFVVLDAKLFDEVEVGTVDDGFVWGGAQWYAPDAEG